MHAPHIQTKRGVFCVLIQRNLPQKEGDSGSFTLPCLIGPLVVKNALADLGASINLMPHSLFRRLGISKLKPTEMSIQLADRYIKYPIGVCENLLVKISKFIFPIDFVVLKMDEDELVPIILRRPFLVTWTEEERRGSDSNEVQAFSFYPGLEKTTPTPSGHIIRIIHHRKARLLEVLRNHKGAIAWSIADIKRIDSSFCTHKILMEDEFKPSVQPQRRVNPNIKEVVKKEVIKLLDVGLIYPIFDSPWVSPVKVVPKKRGMTVVKNENDELIPQQTEGTVLGHTVSGSRIKVDKAKIEAISKLPYPTNVKAIRSFLGHVGFYRRFIKDFSQIARPMTQLLVKDALFNFSEECIQAFDKLKNIMKERQRSTRGQSSSSQEVSIEEKVRRLGVFENNTHQWRYDTLARRPIYLGDVIDWEFLANQGLVRSFLNSINTNPFSAPQWMNIFQINEPVYRELVREFFSSFEFDSSPFKGRATLSGITRAETVKASLMLLEFWPTIGDGSFNTGNTKGGKKAPIESLRLISTISIASTPMRVLTCELMNALSVEPPPYVFKKKSLIAMGVIMELHNRGFCWPATREVEVEEEDEGDDGGNEAAGGYAGHEGVGGSADIYRHMSQGDWQVCQARWMDRQDEQ
ncbi:reverse transcriptase domain-containing protein [Tanacetum coccineum]